MTQNTPRYPIIETAPIPDLVGWYQEGIVTKTGAHPAHRPQDEHWKKKNYVNTITQGTCYLYKNEIQF